MQIVRDVMHKGVVTCSVSTTVGDALRIMLDDHVPMLDHRVHQLVITTEKSEHRRPVGIFTIGDAVSLMAGESGQKQ